MYYHQTDDMHPCYLPDGRILFSSTAPMTAVPCINGGAPIANLYRCNSDGSGMEQLAVRPCLYVEESHVVATTNSVGNRFTIM